ncbi:MAG: hypothetical protein AAF560_08460 [Acidobacteriota bacterium]
MTRYAEELLTQQSTASALTLTVTNVGLDALELEADGLSRETLEQIEPLFRSPPYDRYVHGLATGSSMTFVFSYDEAASKLDIELIDSPP